MDPGIRLEMFLSFGASRPALEFIQLPVQRVPGALSPEVKRPVYEANRSPPSSAEIKNACNQSFLHIFSLRGD
jgi:hypothetical protein